MGIRSRTRIEISTLPSRCQISSSGHLYQPRRSILIIRSLTVTRKLPSTVLGSQVEIKNIDRWQTFQTSYRICAEVGLCCWSGNSYCGSRIDAALGENCTFIGRKGRIRTYHASVGGNWTECWILDVLPTIDIAILRLHRELERGSDGHEGDGHKGKKGRASVWCQYHNPVYPGYGQQKLEIFGCVAPCSPMVQLCESQPAWCGYSEILPASRKRVGG